MKASTRECPLCGSDKTHSRSMVGHSAIVECEECTFVFSEETEPDNAIYSADYFNAEASHKGYLDYEEEIASHIATFTERLKAAEEKLGGPGLVLDIGCALGHFALAAKARGWHVLATDVSPAAAAQTKTRTGVSTFVSELSAPAIKPGMCDLITLYDVLEHVADPKPVLRELAKCVQPQGWLHITTPNVNSLSAKIMGKFWYHFKPGEHFLYFSPDTLRRSLQENGWLCESVKATRSQMSVRAILLRLCRYSKLLFGTALKWAEKLHCADRILTVAIGEMESWARPNLQSQTAQTRSRKILRPRPVSTDHIADLPILSVLCCPDCQGGLDFRREWREIRCTSCPSRFQLMNGIPILLPNRTRHQSLKEAGSA